MHQRRRARSGGGIGEQDVHVARAHLAPVDAVGRALLALDAARDVERLVLVELRRRVAGGVVDLDRHLGIVATGAVVGASKDHVVHVRGAQRLVRGLAHHPAQGLDQVRLAAAVGTDHAGEARLDQKVGRLDEGFETEQAQSRELHTDARAHPDWIECALLSLRLRMSLWKAGVHFSGTCASNVADLART